MKASNVKGRLRRPRARDFLALLAPALNLLFLSGVPLPAPANAQTADTDVCMQGQLRAVPQIGEADRGKPLRLLVAASDASELEQRGFQTIPCDALMQDPEARQKYRNEVCRIANIGGDLVQLQLERALGVAPRMLCESVEKIIGAVAAPVESSGS